MSHISVCVCMCICVYLYVCMCVYVCLCVRVHTWFIHTIYTLGALVVLGIILSNIDLLCCVLKLLFSTRIAFDTLKH